MERSEMVLSKGGGGGGGNTGKGGEGFIDRSKVRILLCDSDSKRLDEAFTLLCKCSYEGIILLSISAIFLCMCLNSLCFSCSLS